MMKSVQIKNIFFLIIIICFYGCVEPFETETQGFEGLLVIDAKLTDEEKQQEVTLSRARPFEIDSTISERNAIVKIVEDTGTEFVFEETVPEKYFSISTFSAKQGHSYQLSVTTVDGSSYFSESVSLPVKADIDELYAEREIQDDGEEVVSILLGNNDIMNDASTFFRYEYEETYKIIAPFYSPFEFELIESGIINGFRIIRVKERVENVKTCFNTDKSTNIILSNTENLQENNLSRFAVRALKRNNYIISHPYSILVRQFSLTSDAYNYYDLLNDFSSSESVFFETQPGFLEGNINSVSSESSKILGYFEVAAVNEKRIFFNYEDLFTNEPLPPYAVNCEPIGMPFVGRATRSLRPNEEENIVLGPNDILVLSDSTATTPLTEGVKNGKITFLGINYDFIEDYIRNAEMGDIQFSVIPPYFTKFRPCGDCTLLGSTEVPDFWIK